MKIVGIICEYNPFHNGHARQIRLIRKLLGEDTAIVCAMSGNYVQRGSPAVFDKMLRARAAVECGADLVVELPVQTALSSAEGFAAGGVRILSKLCTHLCFGSETGDAEKIMSTAKTLLSPDFPPALRAYLDTGLSFPAARQKALESLGSAGSLLARPNDILAVEYCKAILNQNTPMEIFPIHRQGSYHAETADAENPSATAVRKLMLNSYNWRTCIPKEARQVFEGAPLHSLAAGERAVVSRLRTMTESEFESLPYGSEGLWRKLMHASRRENTLEEILTAVKSKRYTRSRLDRMVMCAFLGITKEDLEADVPYTRVLAFNDIGRAILKKAKKTQTFVNAGESLDHPHWELEKHCGDLYGLFRVEETDPPGMEEKRRVYYHKQENSGSV